ncbi:carbohydrate ABC transporter permease [Streptomyces iconiensis]|uniref:Sugar ABC transporter permease n=1 Tax=Streptomyces iconiensis TaxID=1384038 RepID=A0ABT6ZX13_9ACTN|nr:sugar ABC transporter permease [Streptomyces iconiensis]MDJ1133612.1 sugar ABC transporter permease [Streptomyces iconiensis]
MSLKAPPSPAPGRGRAGGGPRRPTSRRSGLARLGPLPWIAPVILLILAVVVWPVIELIRTSFLNISIAGIVRGNAGSDKYKKLFEETDFASVLLWTVLWTVVVVSVTMLLSLALAQLFNQRFPGRRITRWALIAPWAASVLMTAIGFKWMLNQTAGVLNTVMLDLGIIDKSRDWLGSPGTAWPWMMAVAIFVSLPFTTYTLLAGLQTIPHDVYEAATIDGAGSWQTYTGITLPMLRPAFLVGVVINLINVFNSFPIIWAMTQGGPGYDTSTSMVFMYKLKETDIGESAAMSVVNFAMVVVLVLIFLKVSRWNEED